MPKNEELTPQEKAKQYVSTIANTPNEQITTIETILFKGISINGVFSQYKEWLLNGDYLEILFVTSISESISYSDGGLIVTYKKVTNSHDFL